MFVFHHSSCHSSYSRAVSLSLSSSSSQLYAYTLKVSVLFLLLTPYVKLVFISHCCCVQKNFIYFKFFIKHTGLCINSIIAVLALLSHWKFSQSCVNLSPLTLYLSRYSSLYSSVRLSVPVNFLRILVGILCHTTVIWVFSERVFCVFPFIILFTLLDSCMGAVCKLLSSSSLPFLFPFDSSWLFSCFSSATNSHSQTVPFKPCISLSRFWRSMLWGIRVGSKIRKICRKFSHLLVFNNISHHNAIDHFTGAPYPQNLVVTYHAEKNLVYHVTVRTYKLLPAMAKNLNERKPKGKPVAGLSFILTTRRSRYINL